MVARAGERPGGRSPDPMLEGRGCLSRAAAQDLTTSEAKVTPSSDAPAGMLHPPGTDAFPAAPPHSVPAYARTRWTAGLGRWWHAVFARNAYARGADTVRAGHSGHRPFQHLIEPDGEGANDASLRGGAGRK